MCYITTVFNYVKTRTVQVDPLPKVPYH